MGEAVPVPPSLGCCHSASTRRFWGVWMLECSIGDANGATREDKRDFRVAAETEGTNINPTLRPPCPYIHVLSHFIPEHLCIPQDPPDPSFSQPVMPGHALGRGGTHTQHIPLPKPRGQHHWGGGGSQRPPASAELQGAGEEGGHRTGSPGPAAVI